jgi:hypothetical protein
MTAKGIKNSKATGSKDRKLNSKNSLNAISTLCESLSQTGLDTISLAAVLALAVRGLLPSRLEGSLAGTLVKTLAAKLFETRQLELDSTDFAEHLTACIDVDALDSFLPNAGEKALCKTVETAISQFGPALAIDFTKLVSDPLFVGWIHQAALMKRDDYTTVRSAKTLHGLWQITQWFTPPWVSDFLLDECFDSSEDSRKPAPIKFLDSSCGAGHILVPALQRLVERRLKQNGMEVTGALSEVLSKELFGIDVDPQMVRLSAFAIYLTCRDLARHAPLPIPQLFAFSPCTSASRRIELTSPACHGSLLLSLSPRPNLQIHRIDGSKVALSELPERFDAQALNPPYLSHRLMPKVLSKFLQLHYEGCHYDMYAAFLELGIRLMSENGKLSLICQQSFLTTARYEELRRKLIERCRINSIVQLGPGSFASRGGEKVNSAIVSLRAKENTSSTDSKPLQPAHEVFVYKLMSSAAKNIAEIDGINNYSKAIVAESSLLATTGMVPGFPLAPFCPEEVARLFESLPTIAESNSGITLTNGLFTCDNKRFVRHFSEIHNEDEFVPYDKGGGQKWFSTTPYLLEWKNDGNDIREFRARRGQSRALPGERFYFQNGITYSYIGTKGFKARLLSSGSVFDIASSALFCEKLDLNYLLGFLNSALVRFILGTLNPTINFQIGDLRRIPMQIPTADVQKQIAELALEAVELAQEGDRLNHNSPAYKGPLLAAFAPEKTGTGFNRSESKADEIAYENLVSHITSINRREKRIQSAIDEAVFNLYKISSTTRAIITQNEWVASTDEVLIPIPTLNKCRAELKTGSASQARSSKSE